MSIRGAGPAGATLALLLARAGRSVELVDRPTRRRACPEETIVPSARRSLDRLGLEGVWERARGARFERYGTIWNTSEVRWRPGGGDEDLQFERDVLDRELVEAARGLGVDVVEAPRSEARERVIATGRGPIDGARIVSSLPRTIALAARVPAGPDSNAAVIEAVAHGWLWWLPLATGEASLTLFADLAEMEARGRDTVWSEALEEAHGPARYHREAKVAFGAEATAWLREHDDAWLVGDAAGALDPLSSQGLERALASASHAAAVLGTLLDAPDERDSLRAHQSRWEARLFEVHRRETLMFYSREERFSDEPFWAARHAMRDAPREWRPLPTWFTRSDDLERAQLWKPAGEKLERVEGWRVAGEPDAVDELGGVRLDTLLELVAEPKTLDGFLEAARSVPELVTCAENDLVRRLEWLHHQRFVVRANR